MHAADVRRLQGRGDGRRHEQAGPSLTVDTNIVTLTIGGNDVGFSGHDVCASVPYVNGFKLFASGDSYHPTRAGYASGYTPLVRSIIG